MSAALDLLRRLEPHLDALVCYASTASEYEPNKLVQEVRALLASSPVAAPCQHRIADARNPIVKSGYLCIDCGALFSAADHAGAEPAQPVP